MNNQMYLRKKKIYILAIFILLFISFDVLAADETSWLVNNKGWLIHLSASVEQLYKMVTGLAYVIGCSFLFKALFVLKIYGEARVSMSSNANIKEPLTFLFVGTMLIYLPTGFAVIMNTVFNEANVLAYELAFSPLGLTKENGGTALLRILQFIGVISFVRGWVLLARSQDKGASPGAIVKAVAHIIGGVMLMNLLKTLIIVHNTLGVKF